MRPKLVAAVVACLVAANVAAETTPHFQSDFPPEEFKARWAGVFAAMAEKSVAIVQGAPLSNGFIFPRQSNERNQAR